MKKKIILVLIFFILFIKSDYLYSLSEGGVIKKPVLTSKNFDNRATIIILKYKENDKEKTKEIGTGFFINDGKNFIYLVSAGHVFKKALQVLLVAKGTIVFFQKFEDANAGIFLPN